MTDFTTPRILTDLDGADGFVSGVQVVDDWLQKNARKAIKNRTSAIYASFADGTLAGFYTLSAYGMDRNEASGWLRRNSPNPIPVILLGILGVDIRYQTQHLGASLLKDAVLRAMSASDIIGAKALVVEPASSKAAGFYEHYGFRHIEDSPRMFVPLSHHGNLQ